MDDTTFTASGFTLHHTIRRDLGVTVVRLLGCASAQRDRLTEALALALGGAVTGSGWLAIDGLVYLDDVRETCAMVLGFDIVETVAL